MKTGRLCTAGKTPRQHHHSNPKSAGCASALCRGLAGPHRLPRPGSDYRGQRGKKANFREAVKKR